MNKRLTRALLGAGIAGTLALGGCAVPVPEFTPPPEESHVYPVLDETRLDRVLAAVNDTLAKADADGEKGELTTRIDGRARSMRTWEYALAKATTEAEMENPYTPQALSTDPAVEIVAATQEWPRHVVVITDPPAEGNIPLMLVLAQDGPRDPYSLRSWVRLLPATTTPQMHAPEAGSPQLEPDADGLLLSPEEAVSAYADLLNKGDDSEFKDSFEEDMYANLLKEELKGLNQSLSVAGKVTQKNGKRGDIYALETFDGGAIVISGMRSEQTYEKTVPRAKMRVGDLVAALNEGEADVATKLMATYEHMLAFYVPPADSDEKIRLLGAERVLAKVSKPDN